MSKPVCEKSYRKRGEITLRCSTQDRTHDFCCYQYYCPDSGRYENAAQWHGCRLRKKNDRKEPSGI